MKNSIFIFTVLIIFLIGIIIINIVYISYEKIAFVDNNKLISGYKETTKLKAEFEKSCQRDY